MRYLATACATLAATLLLPLLFLIAFGELLGALSILAIGALFWFASGRLRQRQRAGGIATGAACGAFATLVLTAEVGSSIRYPVLIVVGIVTVLLAFVWRDLTPRNVGA